MNTEDARRRRSGVPRSVALTMLVAAVVGTAFGLVGAAFATSTYTAEATVLVSPLAGNPFTPNGNGDDLTNLQTEAQLASSDAVAQLVTGGATTGTGSDILNGLSVKVPSNTQVLVLDYRAGSLNLAKARAQSFAQSYLGFRVSRNEQVVAAQALRIQDGIDTQTARLSQLAKKKQTVTSPRAALGAAAADRCRHYSGRPALNDPQRSPPIEAGSGGGHHPVPCRQSLSGADVGPVWLRWACRRALVWARRRRSQDMECRAVRKQTD